MRHLLFDVLGTIVYDPFHEALPRFFGLSFEELLAAKHPTAWLEFEEGRIGEDEFLDRFFADGRAYDHAGLCQRFRETYRYLDGMQELLADLAPHSDRPGSDPAGGGSFRMHYFSNYPIWYRWIEQRLGLARHAPWSFVSCELGLRKPDPAVFDAVLAALDAAPADCVLIDDQSRNVRAAAAHGFRVIPFEGAESLRLRLRELGFPA